MNIIFILTRYWSEYIERKSLNLVLLTLSTNMIFGFSYISHSTRYICLSLSYIFETLSSLYVKIIKLPFSIFLCVRTELFFMTTNLDIKTRLERIFLTFSTRIEAHTVKIQFLLFMTVHLLHNNRPT